MNRLVQLVKFKSTDLVVHVGALSALQAIEFHQRLVASDKAQDIISQQLLAFVCNEDGSPRFLDGAAAIEFLKTIRPGQLKAIINAGTRLNKVDDESLEEELKN